MIRSFRSKALKRYWVDADPRGLRPDWVRKVLRILRALDEASAPEDLAIVGHGFHELTADLAGRYAMVVSRNWRITFGFDGDDVVEVDLEDYHG